MRNWKWIALVVAAAIPVAFVASVLWPQSDRITQENFQGLREGMDWSEVKAILGSPGDYRTEPVAYDDAQRSAYFRPMMSTDEATEYTLSHTCYWSNDASMVVVSFNRSGEVDRFGWVDAIGPKPDSLTTFRWRVNRQWYKWTGQTGCVRTPLL